MTEIVAPGRPTPPERIDKPWGYELVWAKTDRYVGKILHVAAGHQLSYQFHRVKDETIFVLQGEIELDLAPPDGQRVTLTLRAGESIHLRPQTRHRIRALTDCDLLEASTPELDDVVRIEDDYGRART